MFDGNNYYELMGVRVDATQEQLRHAYHRLALKYHPDTGTEKNDEAMKKLNFIYSILSDPIQREAYDETIAFSRYKHKHQEKRQEHHRPPDERPEDFSRAVFVNGIEATDAEGRYKYIKLGDFLYYKVKTRKKALFFNYQGDDYFRTEVLKIYSLKRNDFRRRPLFAVKYQNVNHIIFEEEFRRFWLTEESFNSIEKKRAIKTFIIGIIIIAFIFYKLLSMQ